MLPTFVLGPRELRDAELVLWGALGDGHCLGMPVEHLVALPAEPIVRLTLPAAVRDAALQAHGLLLADDELTPIARLVQPSVLPDGLVGGRLVRERWREGNEVDALALAPSDADLRCDGVLVLGRPPVAVDEPDLDALRARSQWLLLAVPDRPDDTSGIPTSIMLDLAQEVVQTLGESAQAQLRTVPLAWRSPESDGALVAALAARVGASKVLFLAPAGASRGDQAWRLARQALDDGRDEQPIPALRPPVEAALRRWRPPRHRRGLVLMFTGLSGSGKSTVARDLRTWLQRHSTRSVTLLDGDVVRRLLSSELGYDRAARILNVRRIGFVAAEVARHGGVAICAPIAPYADTRAEVRAMAQATGGFVLVHVSTPLEECERRDLKGLYRSARVGKIAEFTGVSDPYEVPQDADLRVDTSALTRAEALTMVVDRLREEGWVTDVR